MMKFHPSLLLCFAPALMAVTCTYDEDPGSDKATTEDPATNLDGAMAALTYTHASGPNKCVIGMGMQHIGGYKLSSYGTVGSDGSVRPTSPRGVITARTNGACPGTTTERSTTAGDWATTSFTDTWYTTTGINTLGNCNDIASCDDEFGTGCDGNYEVTVTNGDCDGLPDVWTYFSSSSIAARKAYDSDADCSAGSGRFKLVPIQRVDHDQDGVHAWAFLPLQTSGSGVMTRKAWVTGIDKVSTPSGATMRVVKSDQEFSYSAADALNNASTVSSTLANVNDFSTGLIDGNPVILIDEIGWSSLLDVQVDMEWSCGSGGTDPGLPAGYQFKLSDLGCGSSPQALTIRYATSPKRVMVEQYGNAAMRKVEPTTTIGGEEAFAYDGGGLSISGSVVSTSAQQMVVDLDYATYAGVSVCTPGRYTLSPE